MLRSLAFIGLCGTLVGDASRAALELDADMDTTPPRDRDFARLWRPLVRAAAQSAEAASAKLAPRSNLAAAIAEVSVISRMPKARPLPQMPRPQNFPKAVGRETGFIAKLLAERVSPNSVPPKAGLLASAIAAGAVFGTSPAQNQALHASEGSQGSLMAALRDRGMTQGQVKEKLACGAKGCAYNTEDPDVVLKTVSAHVIAEDLEMECQTARALKAQGGHYLTCYGVGTITAADLDSAPSMKEEGIKEGDKFLLLERAQGRPLDTAIASARQAGGGGLRVAVEVLCELATMVDDDQSRLINGAKYEPDGITIIHNDLHPENLFVNVADSASTQQGHVSLKAIDYDITQAVSNNDAAAAAKARSDLYRWYATEFICVLAGDSVEKNAQGAYQFTVGAAVMGSSFPSAMKPFFQEDSERAASNPVMKSESLEKFAAAYAGDGRKLFAEEMAGGWIHARSGMEATKDGLSPEFESELKGRPEAEKAMKMAFGETFWTLQKVSNGEAPSDADFKRLKETLSELQKLL